MTFASKTTSAANPIAICRRWRACAGRSNVDIDGGGLHAAITSFRRRGCPTCDPATIFVTLDCGVVGWSEGAAGCGNSETHQAVREVTVGFALSCDRAGPPRPTFWPDGGLRVDTAGSNLPSPVCGDELSGACAGRRSKPRR
jgi:hypothetical protein